MQFRKRYFLSAVIRLVNPLFSVVTVTENPSIFTGFPPPLRPRFRYHGSVDRGGSHLAGQFGERQTLPNDLVNDKIEAVRIVQILAIVVPERLLIEVAKKMKRFHGYIGSVQASF
jgi:hypothetical protein